MFVLLICILIFYSTREWNPDFEELYNVDKTIAVEEIEKKGYIDVAEVHQKESDEINKFLMLVQSDKRAVLRTYWIQDEELYTNFYYYDPKLREIRLHTYLPWRKAGIGPMRSYSKEFSMIEEDGVTRIILNPIPNLYFATDFDFESLYEEVLYSYYKE